MIVSNPLLLAKRRMLRICYLMMLSVTASRTVALQEDSSSTPWPYHQIHPPVNETDGRTPLYFSLVFSFPGSSYVSIGSLPGIQIALDYINSEPSILPGYSLHYTLTDSQVAQLCVFFSHRKYSYS